MFVAAWGDTKRSYSVETPHSEGTRRRDGAQGLSWLALLLCNKLTSLAPLYEVFGVSYGCGPVESRSVCFIN
jgi:hypothetical protein